MPAGKILNNYNNYTAGTITTRPVLRRIDSNTTVTSLTPDNAQKRRSRKRRVSRRKLFNRRKYDINKPKHSVAATVSNLTSHLVSSENQRLTPSTVSSESHNDSHHVSLPSTSSLSHNLSQNIHPATTCIPLSDHNSTSLEPSSSVGQTTSAEETGDSRCHPNIEFFEFKKSVKEIELDDGWMVTQDDGAVHIYKVKISPIVPPTIVLSVTINTSMTWHAHALGKLITRTSCPLLGQFPERIPDIVLIKSIVHAIETAVVCPGNPDKELLEVFENRSDNQHTAAAYVDIYDIQASDGNHYAHTVRHNKCEILCQRRSKYPRVCSACQSYRSTLRVLKSRFNHADCVSRTAHNSHTNIRFLNEEEKEARLRGVQKKKKSVLFMNQKLKE